MLTPVIADMVMGAMGATGTEAWLSRGELGSSYFGSSCISVAEEQVMELVHDTLV
jgi:hypothetical protein